MSAAAAAFLLLLRELIRVCSATCACILGGDADTDKLRIFRSFDFAKLKEQVDPVAYNVGRETVPWIAVKAVLEAEAAAETSNPSNTRR